MLKEKNAKRRCMINVHHQFSNMKTFLWYSDIWIKAVYLLKRNIISNIQIVILKMETFLTVWCNSNILCLKIWIDYWFTLDGFFSLSALQYLVSISLSDRKSIWNGDVWLRKKNWLSFSSQFFFSTEYRMLKLENKTDAVFQVSSYFGVHLWRARRKSPMGGIVWK